MLPLAVNLNIILLQGKSLECLLDLGPTLLLQFFAQEKTKGGI